MSDEQGRLAIPTAREVRQGTTEAFITDGYGDEDGNRNLGLLRDGIFTEVKPCILDNKKERAAKALRRRPLISGLFPTLPPGSQWEEQPDPALAEAIYKEVDRIVWTQLDPRSNGFIQRRVAEELGDGLVLLRTKVGDDRLDAVYLTRDRSCITQDMVRGFETKADRLAEDFAGVEVMLVERQPENAKKFLAEFNRVLHAAQLHGANSIQLAIDALNGDGPTEEAAEEAEATTA